MDFKTKQRLKNGFTALGLIGLGYFIGRPDHLHRIARSMENYSTESRTRYLVPTRMGTAPNLVQTHQRGYGQPQPAAVNSSAPGQHGWNDFFHPGGRFSIFMPPTQVKEVTNSRNSKTFSVEAGSEFYMVRYDTDTDGTQFGNQNREQFLQAEVGKSWTNETISKEFALVAQRSFALNGNPGIEMHLQHRTKPIKMIVRKMFVGNRLYAMAVSSPYQENTQIFLNSFRPH